MHAPYDKSRNSYRTEGKTGVGFIVLPLVALALIALAIMHPKSSIWIAQAVEAEFGGVYAEPTQIVQPDMAAPLQTVRAD